MSVEVISAALNAELERKPPPQPPAPLSHGVHLDVSETDYHNDPCDVPSLSVSIAKHVVSCPSKAHHYHPRLGGAPYETSTKMDRGTLIHKLLLGKGPQIVVVDTDDWRPKKAKEARDEAEAAGKTAVTRKLNDDAHVAAEALRAKLSKLGYPLTGQSEVVLRWAVDGVECRGMVDHLQDCIIDLKITDSASPRAFRNRIIAMGYHIQEYAYRTACEQLKGERLPFVFLACEPFPPYAVTENSLRESMRMCGQRDWELAVKRWRQCLSTGQWPDYAQGIVHHEARVWEIEGDYDEDV